MMNKTKCVLVVSAIAAVVGVAAIAGVADAGNRFFPTNEDGLTIGSASDAPSYEAEPDLIAVVATNGEEGYVYATDLHEAEGWGLTTDEEIDAYMEERIAKVSEALAAELSAEGEVALEAEDVRHLIVDGTIEKLVAASDDEGAEVAGDSEESAAVEVTLDYSISGDDLEAAYWRACDACAVIIPVYDADGKTVVGEFKVG